MLSEEAGLLASTAHGLPSLTGALNQPQSSSVTNLAPTPVETPFVVTPATPATPATSAVIPFGQYTALVPVPEQHELGIPFAFMSCGYAPRCLARSLKDAIVSRIGGSLGVVSNIGVQPPSFPRSPTDPTKSFIVPRHTILWLDSNDSPQHRLRGLLLQTPIAADVSFDSVNLIGGPWNDGHQKHLLQPYKHDPYNGTTWYGVYERVPLVPSLQYLPLDDLYNIPHKVCFIPSIAEAVGLRNAWGSCLDSEGFVKVLA